MFGLEEGSALRRLVIVVQHRLSQEEALGRLTEAFNKHPDWLKLVKEHTWFKKFAVRFILVKDGHVCDGMLTIDVRRVHYRLENIPLLYLPAKPLIEMQVTQMLKETLAH